MPLETGKNLSHYRIVERIGEGGMGVVWQAEDSNLGRHVAIKVLPDSLAADPDRLERFRREAKLLASLNHPNIATIHGLEEDDGTRFLILEYVPGDDLSARIAEGPLPMKEALAIARQIAEALETAHENGVLHRDVKPANVRVTEDGHVKVLDFGLAKTLDAAAIPGSGDPYASPTLKHSPTQAGVLLGTAAYMSPEQARARPVDRRADIWAFGCVLFEMLTGKEIFAGETTTDTLASVLRAEPDWNALPAATPPSVRRLLHRCLERDPKQRLRDIGEARITLEHVGEPEPGDERAAARRPSRGVGLAVVGAAVVIGAALILQAVLRGAPAELPLRKFDIAVKDATQSRPAISPDGKRIVYNSDNRLWIRDLDQLRARPIANTDGAVFSFWSPDGSWIGFADGSGLWRIPAGGGQRTAVALGVAVHYYAGGAVWRKDGSIVYSPGDSGLWEVSAQGGDPRVLLAPEPDEEDFHNVVGLPDDRGLLFVVHRNDVFDTIVLYADGKRTELLTQTGQAVSFPTYSPSGHILYHRQPVNTGIWAVPFALDSLEVTGEPFLATPHGQQPSISDDETLVYSPAIERQETTLRWVDRDGVPGATIGEPTTEQIPLPALSPDGRRVAVTVRSGESFDVWVYDIASDTRTRLTFDGRRKTALAWHPDGKRIAYSRGETLTDVTIHMAAADGTGEPVELVRGLLPAFSSDGKHLAYTDPGKQFTLDLGYLPLEDGGDPTPFLVTGGSESAPRFSPDGRYIAYVADESGRPEIYVKPFPTGAGKWMVSRDGGDWPVWSRGGDRLFFLDTKGVMEVEVVAEPSLRFGRPRRLFEYPFPLVQVPLGESRGFDVDPDGTRFLMVVPTDPDAPAPALQVVQNWSAEFK